MQEATLLPLLWGRVSFPGPALIWLAKRSEAKGNSQQPEGQLLGSSKPRRKFVKATTLPVICQDYQDYTGKANAEKLITSLGWLMHATDIWPNLVRWSWRRLGAPRLKSSALNAANIEKLHCWWVRLFNGRDLRLIYLPKPLFDAVFL